MSALAEADVPCLAEEGLPALSEAGGPGRAVADLSALAAVQVPGLAEAEGQHWLRQKGWSRLQLWLGSSLPPISKSPHNVAVRCLGLNH